MRTQNSIKNSITSAVTSALGIIVGFVAQAIFIKILGIEYLGLNGLFSNVLNMLNIFELGIGASIIYSLYIPVANNDIENIKGITNFYKKIYNTIAIIIFTIGLSFCPFIKYFVEDINININIYAVYILSLLSIVSSYIFTYKRSIINADQKVYVINIIHSIYLIALNVFQLIILYYTKNFYFYLGVKIFCQIIENLLITTYANKKYRYLKEKNIKKIEKSFEKNIFKNVKALFLHKVGSALVFGTDNIIISKFLGVITVGYYSNYSTIINTINNLLSKTISAVTASVGNLCINNSTQKKFDVFKKIRFVNYFLSCYTAMELLCVIQTFISIWLGSQYLISDITVIILIVSYFSTSMRTTYGVYRDSNGIWEKDKYVPICEAIINITTSIALAKIMGLIGVFIGTIISGLIWWCYAFPKYVYKPIFERKYKNYIFESLKFLGTFTVTGILCFEVSKLIAIDSLIVKLLLQFIVTTLIFLIVNMLFYKKDENYIFFKNLVLSRLKKQNI